jgi:hypothetical protein
MNRWILLLLIVIHSSGAPAYQEPTHQAMSGEAAVASGILDDSLLVRLKVNPEAVYPSDNNELLTLFQLIQEGAYREDHPLARSVNHFFDPQTESGIGPGVASPTWALEDRGFVHLPQIHSYVDALDYYYEMITKPEAIDRRKKVGLLFQTLGHIGHHIQDMAQPQHVRGDWHLSYTSGYSRYERHVNDEMLEGNLQFRGYAPVGGPDGGIFVNPRSFWHTEVMNPAVGRGMAEFTQTNFVTDDTNFDKQGKPGSRFPLPRFSDARVHNADANVLLESVGKPVPAVCQAPNPHCFMSFLATNVEDLYRPSESGENPRTSAHSIFDQDLNAHGQTMYSVNRFTFDTAHAILVKRAVGYTAGFYRFFFRGKLEVGLPQEGIYAAVDHLSLEGGTKDTGGFDKVRVNVRNVTPGLSQGVEPIPAGGEMRLLVTYHRNRCYVSDLSGEFGALNSNDQPLVADPLGCRTSNPESRLSAPQAASAAINSAAGQDVTFHFLNRIPINATDVFIRVVYRGTLGQTTDAIAISAEKDISEPSYVYSLPERYDQFKWSAYPTLESGPYTWEQWCGQGGMTLEECNDRYGRNRDWRFAPWGEYDPNVSPSTAGAWRPIAEQTPFNPALSAPAYVGAFGRAAVLADLRRPVGSIPTQLIGPYFLWIKLSEFGVSTPEQFTWEWGGFRVNEIQVDSATSNYPDPVVQYKKARGAYLFRGDDAFYSEGTATNVPAFWPVATNVNLPD